MSEMPVQADETQATQLLGWNTCEKTYRTLLMSHPLITGKTLLPTGPVKNLCSAILRAVMLRKQGLCFTAKSGAGKSSAMFFVNEYLASEFPQLVVYNHFTHNYQTPSIRAFFKLFLDSVGANSATGDTPALRSRLTNKIIDDARNSGLDYAVILIDEAQAMSLEDFHFLKDTVNNLEKQKVCLITILMAQEPEWTSVRDMMIEKGKLDLLSRFALLTQPFRTLCTLKDISELFTLIDESIYSEQLPLTWTEFFFPRAFANGFRLESQAVIFYKIFEAICVENNEAIEFPARQTFYVIRAFLVDNCVYDSEVICMPVDSWTSAIKEGKMEEALAISNQNKSTARIAR